MPNLKTNRAMKPCSMPLQVAQYGPWNRFTYAIVASSIRWLTEWLQIIRSLKICCKMRSWLCGDVPPLIHLKQVLREAGLSPSCTIEPLIIYVKCAVDQLFKKRHLKKQN